MQQATQLTAQIIQLTRRSGYLTPDHALSIAGNLLESAPLPPQFVHLAPALVRQAAIFDPFDREKLRLADDVNSQVEHPPFSEWLRVALDLTMNEPMTDNIPLPDMETATANEIIAYMKAQPSNTSRLPALLHLWQDGRRDELLESINILTASKSGLLAGPVMAWGAYGAGEPLLAEMLLDEGVPSFLAHNLRARLALDNGEVPQAVEHLHTSLAFEPFQTGVIEQLAALQTTTTSAPDENVHICLYTWNKPELLAQTMASLEQTRIGDARITILNNGTSLCSPETLEAKVREAAPRLIPNFVHLPINIGAPAARNWLLALPEVAESHHVAFLDDDVLLPKEWLTSYMRTLNAFPDAVAVGPKCVNPGLATIQYAFRNFQEVGDRKIRFTANAPTLMDMGQFDAPRPSLTVMGCCHLFDMERAKKLGVPHFDVRFSPSQVDDIEHDLQIWNAGGHVIFDGNVPVIHLQDTGKGPKTPMATAQAYANHYKMENKFELEELQRMDRAVHDADAQHWRTSVQTILPTLKGIALDFWGAVSE